MNIAQLFRKKPRIVEQPVEHSISIAPEKQVASVPCKVCGSATEPIGSVDANKCCIDRFGPRSFPVSPIEVEYAACSNCGFIFTTYMDQWTDTEFKTNIYNADYEEINPPIIGRSDVPVHETPAYATGLRIAGLFDGAQSQIRILDFGAGGNPGATGQALIDSGFSVDSYDPYRADAPAITGTYGLIIAIEVLEHCTDLASVRLFMRKHLAENGLVWVETLLHPFPTPPDALDSWYIAPRDGHISIHTFPSISLFFNSIGLNYASTIHGGFAFKKLPDYPNKIFL